MPLRRTTTTWSPAPSWPASSRQPTPSPPPALENYIKRLEKLEEVTSSFPGVEKSFAIQAGREVRIMVAPDKVSEDQMVLLARDIAKKIEEELEYPGQIKVNMIRETKVIEYAK